MGCTKRGISSLQGGVYSEFLTDFESSVVESGVFADSPGGEPPDCETDGDEENKGQADDMNLKELHQCGIEGLFDGKVLWIEALKVVYLFDRMPRNGKDNEDANDNCREKYDCVRFFHWP